MKKIIVQKIKQKDMPRHKYRLSLVGCAAYAGCYSLFIVESMLFSAIIDAIPLMRTAP